MFHVKHCIFASAEGERHCKESGTAGNEPLLHGTAELPPAKPRNILCINAQLYATLRIKRRRCTTNKKTTPTPLHWIAELPKALMGGGYAANLHCTRIAELPKAQRLLDCTESAELAKQLEKPSMQQCTDDNPSRRHYTSRNADIAELCKIAE